MQMHRESYRQLLGCVLPVRFGFLAPAEAAGGAHLSEGLHWAPQALSEVLRCPHVSALRPKVNSENYFCQQQTPRLSPDVNCSDSDQAANPGQTIQPGQMDHLLGRKEDSTGAPLLLLHHFFVAVAKRSRRTTGRRGWTGFHPLDWQDGFACPLPTPKRGQSRSSSLAPTSSWQGGPCRRSVLGLWCHHLHCFPNKESREYHLQRELCHVFTSEHSKCHGATNIKISRVSWNRFPSRDVPSTSLETFQSDLTGSSFEQLCLIAQLTVL